MSFQFQLSIKGDTKSVSMHFQEVSGLNMEAKIEDVQEGGENRFKYRLPTATKYSNLVLQRGIVQDDNAIYQWIREVLTSGSSHTVDFKTLKLSLLDEAAKVLMSWTFFNSYPTKWSISEFKSQEKTIAIESLEFAYDYFEKTDT